MKEKPVPDPEPVPELELLREQVRELTAVKTGFAFGHATYCGHAQHATMTALAAEIAEKVNWRGEALQHRDRITELEATIARVRRANEQMRGWCSPHDFAIRCADHIDEALGQPTVPEGA